MKISHLSIKSKQDMLVKIISFFLTSCHLISNTTAELSVYYSNAGQINPILIEETKVPRELSVNGLRVNIFLVCSSDYPVEWIYNEEREDQRVYHGNAQWTDRNVNVDYKNGTMTYRYLAHVHLQYDIRMEGDDTIVCAAIHNRKENRKISLKMSPGGGYKNKYLVLTSNENLTDLGDPNFEGALGEPISGENATTCGARLYFKNLGELGLFWRCRGDPDMIDRELRQDACKWSAMYCGNLYRKAKLNVCLEVVQNPRVHDLSADWKKMDESIPAGIILCEDSDNYMAQEYFFTTSANGSQQIHFSWANIEPDEMISMEILNDTYYVNETLKTNCNIPKYGFSFSPSGAIHDSDDGKIWKSFNSTEKNDWGWVINIETVLTHPGTYDVQCSAPVWNTTEWATKNKTIIVKKIVPPHFAKPIEDFVFREGEGETGNLSCLPLGDPIPKISWDHVNRNFLTISGHEIKFFKVHPDIEGSYVCNAVNEFGQFAKKTFNVTVRTNDMRSVWIPIVVVVLILILVGMGFSYWKYHTLKKKLTNSLTPEEIAEFREGKLNQVKSSEQSGNLSIFVLPYDTKYEIPRTQMKVGNELLGSGAYGIVLKGVVEIDSQKVNVAVKCPKESVDIAYFKAFLAELKILARIGANDHIVNLVAAWTENIENREMYICVELCEISLHEFLQRNSAQFSNYVHDGILTRHGGTSYENIVKFSTFDLIRWSEEIAIGMNFLAVQNIVHGDLAARNVLLSADNRAKICDFGLARQLEDYNYIKSNCQECPLPWKWMAIESLTQMKFSTASDVWAYGVVLWELFSLGDVPYPCINWTLAFPSQIRQGLRLERPIFCSGSIYQQMCNCWALDPKERPIFADLRNFFGTLKDEI